MNETCEKLLDNAAEYSRISRGEALNEIADPQWGVGLGTWRQHVPDAIAENWDILSIEARLAVYLTAESLAAAQDVFDWE